MPFLCDGDVVSIIVVASQGGAGTATVVIDTSNDTPRTSMPKRANHRAYHRIHDKGSSSHTGDEFTALVTQLLDLFSSVLEFVRAALTTHGPYINVAQWKSYSFTP